MLPFDTGTCCIEGVLVLERGDPSPLSLRFWGLRGLPMQVSAQCPSPCWVSRLLVCLWQLPPALGTAGALCRVRGPSAPAGLSQEPCGYRRALRWGRQRAAGSHSLVVQMGTAHLGSLDMLHLQEHRGRMQTPKKTRDGSKCGRFRSGWRLRGQDLRCLSCAVLVLDGSGLRASGGPRANPAAPSRCVTA